MFKSPRLDLPYYLFTIVLILFDRATPVSAAYTPIQATLIGISAGLLSFVTITGNLMVMISFKMDKQLQVCLIVFFTLS